MGITKELSSVVMAVMLAATPIGESNVESMDYIPQVQREVTVIEKTAYRNIVDLPDIESSFKTFMDYRTITDSTSKQWALQQDAHTDENGLRKIGEYYCIAVGSGIVDKIGTKLKIKLVSGSEFYAIVADQKADIHTDKTNKYRHVSNGRGNVIEFIVNENCLPAIVLQMGNVDYMPNGNFSGEILEIEVM